MIFADDIALCATDREEVGRKTENWRRVLEDRGMTVSRKKTKYMHVLKMVQRRVWMESWKERSRKESKQVG